MISMLVLKTKHLKKKSMKIFFTHIKFCVKPNENSQKQIKSLTKTSMAGIFKTGEPLLLGYNRFYFECELGCINLLNCAMCTFQFLFSSFYACCINVSIEIYIFRVIYDIELWHQNFINSSIVLALKNCNIYKTHTLS